MDLKKTITENINRIIEKKDKFKIKNVDIVEKTESFAIKIYYNANDMEGYVVLNYCNTSCGIKSIDKINNLLYNVPDNDTCLKFIQEVIIKTKESNQKHYSKGCFYYISPVIGTERGDDFYNYMEKKGFTCMKQLNPNSGNIIAFIIVEK